MTLHNRFMDDIIFVPSNSSTSSSSKKKKSREISRGRIYPRNHGTSARFFDLISFQFVRVISLDGSAWFKLRQLVVTRPKEEASYKKKKKKRQMRTFLKFRENSVRNLCPSWNSNRSETPFIYERNFNIWFIWTLSFISRNLKLQNEQ